MSETQLFDRVAIIGCGLIGSSLARAMQRDGMAGEIRACVRGAESRAKIMELGIADSVHEKPADAVEGADLVVLGAPVGANESIAQAMAPALAPEVIVTDVGSVKQAVIRDVSPYLDSGMHFVPGHPIAGSEHSGPEAGFADLFDNRYCILTPPPGTDEAAVERVAALWRRCGARVELMDAKHHDKVLAITSHLPHLIAYTIVDTAANLEESERAEVIRYSAGGFRDFTRIAASDPVMWRDVFLNNRDAVLEMLQRFNEDISQLQRAIRWGEGDLLQSIFHKTCEIRRSVIEMGQAGTFDPREPGSQDGSSS